MRGRLEVFPSIKLYVHGVIFLMRGHELILFLRDFCSADHGLQFRVLVY